MSVLGIDPGTHKVGYAVAVDAESPALALGIVPLAELPACAKSLVEKHAVDAVAIGHGTNASKIAVLLEDAGAPVHVVDETDTTYRARAVYFSDHPPSGWRRLIPIGLQLPPRPIDDYAALLIARRYIGRGKHGPNVV